MDLNLHLPYWPDNTGSRFVDGMQPDKIDIAPIYCIKGVLADRHPIKHIDKLDLASGYCQSGNRVTHSPKQRSFGNLVDVIRHERVCPNMNYSRIQCRTGFFVPKAVRKSITEDARKW